MLLPICFVLTWNLDPLFQLVLGSREHCWGQEASSNQELLFWWKKKLLKLCCWLDDRPGVKWSWSCVELDVGLQDEARWREMGFSENPLLCPFCQELTVLFWGCWASTESLNLNDSRDRGVHTSAPPLSRNQRRKCPWMKHGPQSWLAAREDTRSAGIVFCVLDPFCWAGGHVVCLGDGFIIWVVTLISAHGLSGKQLITIDIVAPLCSI